MTTAEKIRWYKTRRSYDEKALYAVYNKIKEDFACRQFGGFDEAFLIALESAPYRSKILLLL